MTYPDSLLPPVFMLCILGNWKMSFTTKQHLPSFTFLLYLALVLFEHFPGIWNPRFLNVLQTLNKSIETKGKIWEEEVPSSSWHIQGCFILLLLSLLCFDPSSSRLEFPLLNKAELLSHDPKPIWSEACFFTHFPGCHIAFFLYSPAFCNWFLVTGHWRQTDSGWKGPKC